MRPVRARRDRGEAGSSPTPSTSAPRGTRRGGVRRRRRASGPTGSRRSCSPTSRPLRAPAASSTFAAERAAGEPPDDRGVPRQRLSRCRCHAEPAALAVELPTSLTAEATARFEERDRVAAVAAVARVLEPTSVASSARRAGRHDRRARSSRNLLAGGFAGDLHVVNRRGGPWSATRSTDRCATSPVRSISRSSRSRPRRWSTSRASARRGRSARSS